MAKIAYYYQKMETSVNQSDDIEDLINLHVTSFSKYGWEAIRLDESAAKKHPLYAIFDDCTTILGKSCNRWEYTRACYMRWLAYATTGFPFADFDVINYGFTPEDAANIRASSKIGPNLISGAGAVGLVQGDEYNEIMSTFISFIENPRIEGLIDSDDINDMNILREYRPNYYEAVPYNDPRWVKDYTLPLWDIALLVHYPYHYTAVPRSETIRRVRPPSIY